MARTYSEDHAGYHGRHGGYNSLIGGAINWNWPERRQRQLEFLDEEPQLLIIGAGIQSAYLFVDKNADFDPGQARLNRAARLQVMGISSLIIDKNSRTGDNWRLRYRVIYSALMLMQKI